MRLEDIKEGDHLFYTEKKYGSNYADALMHIRCVNGVDYAHPICMHFCGEYINESGYCWGNDLPVANHYDEKCWQPTSYTVYCGDAAAWMSENYKLRGVK